jgi:hypothetical protein
MLIKTGVIHRRISMLPEVNGLESLSTERNFGIDRAIACVSELR